MSLSIPENWRGVALWITDEKGRVFFQQRDSSSKVAPLQYGLWGGRVEEGETPEYAAKREMLEELGVELGDAPFTTIHETPYTNVHGDITLYLAELKQAFSWPDVQIQEGAGGSFFTIEEALQMDLAEMSEIWVKFMQNKSRT